MDQKLKELTEKLYQEGVTKGNEKAEQIVAEANQKSKQIIAEAEKKAQQLIAEAEKKAAELDKNTKSELQLASKQMISALEQEVVGLINGQITSTEIEKAVADDQFIQQLIHAAVTNWAPKQDLLVVVPSEKRKDVEDFFSSKAKGLLN
ncbi:MAG TPA: hypothetical protein PLF35_07100, partial [Prolixibacteraceae bacterium]|nr:hypothetical protein [Prolixibacteraceae bacterium]